ncbi:hypothetical protein MLD38_017717 [Melastoma candidum]|uniref:Uncharacterized protein n=1 Tax=Melastoma candidum TaxID=119954 RepID=A0ACB9QQQ2_9MYRT|nr:hypothetical protein MLD38_017717 [Melastoma candidum]
MGNPFFQTRPILPLISLFLIFFTSTIASIEHRPAKTTSCKGPISECSSWVEFEMDSEANLRILAATQVKHISYGALMPGTTPCSLKGKSYYNCMPGEANPYTRPCSVITQCRN